MTDVTPRVENVLHTRPGDVLIVVTLEWYYLQCCFWGSRGSDCC